MEFEQLVIKEVVPLFIDHGFRIVRHHEDYFHFKTILVEAVISYNKWDKTSLFEVGGIDEILSPITNNLIRHVFGLDIEVDQVTMEGFVNKISLLLKTKGLAILRGDESKLLEIKIFSRKESAAYTASLLQR